jgi:hypothetical protein
MAKTIGQLKTTITSRLHGTTLNKISDFYVLCRDTAENMLSRIDPAETNRRALLTNAVYDKVYDYSLPADFKAPSNLAKQSDQYNFSNNSSLARTYNRQFGNQKADNQFAIVWENTIQFMRFAKYLNAPALIDKADSLTENGAWAVGSNASDLVLDTLNYVSGTGSLKATTSSPGAIVNVILRIGNDSSNYYSKTITAGHFDSFVTGWNLCRFDLSDAVLTGTVDTENIDYIRVTVTYNTNQTAYFEKTLTNAVDLSVNSGNYFSNGAVFAYLNFGSVTSLTTLRLDNITANIGTLYDLSYYSNYLFRSSAGTWIEQPTADTDILNLSSVSYKIFEAEMCKIITQQVQGAMGAFDFAYWNLQLEGDDDHLGLYDQYLQQFPSERIEAQTDYYNVSDDYEDPDSTGTNMPISYNN